MALLVACPTAPAAAPTAACASTPASGPANPLIAPVTAPTAACFPTSPQLTLWPEAICEPILTPAPIAAPSAAPINTVQTGQQCPVGSLRVSGLPPT